MFTGIIETMGIVEEIRLNGTNKEFTISSAISNELKVDQSLAHNGVCLTVTSLENGKHQVTAIDETLLRSNLGDLKIGESINLERAMSGLSRIDGHLVQGHVDTVGIVKSVLDKDGSWIFTFNFPEENKHLLVDKGSVCINGVSLTVINPTLTTFQVAIIPYTYENTSFKFLQEGDSVNLEFDILGKYIARYAAAYKL
ncbi:riboflavin synthase subunit alpha [Bacteroidota bacterium]|nr:riboflavin synthase subunit alpha [Bacteroidota bacterium]